MKKDFELTKTDVNAIKHNDSNYINQKGADLYLKEEYEKASEYYRIASAMGNMVATSNLGYCYLYGRGMEPNLSLALAYFEIAAANGNIDACYKLGDIYGSDKWGIEDKEMSIYFYRIAASLLIDDEWEEDFIICLTNELRKYPSLAFALGRELMPSGMLPTNLEQAYQFLIQAYFGYENELRNGNKIYEDCFNNVINYLENPIFEPIKEKYDEFLEEDDDEYLA